MQYTQCGYAYYPVQNLPSSLVRSKTLNIKISSFTRCFYGCEKFSYFERSD